MEYRPYIIAFFVLFAASSYASPKDSLQLKSRFRHAERQYELRHYDKALPDYLLIDQFKAYDVCDPTTLALQIGNCYYNLKDDRTKSIPYFEKYLNTTDSIYDVHFFLAEMYQLNYQFDKAIAQYEKFKEYVDKDTLVEHEVWEAVEKEVSKHIESCYFGKMLITNQRNVAIENLGANINTKWSDYGPVITNDEKKLVFTRRSPENSNGKLAPDGDYFEDIMISRQEPGNLFSQSQTDSLIKAGYQELLPKFKFSNAEKIGNEVDGNSNEAAVQFSHDDHHLYIYKDNHVWVTDEIEGAWKAPHNVEGFQGAVNSDAFEPSVCFNATEDEIYIASEREGGYGGLDIWKSVKKDGVWQKAQNLGPTINTPFNEDAPYIDPDGRSLYFSSKGHSSIGGYDIFKAILVGDNWTSPQNMGYPVNSTGDDIFYTMPSRDSRAYFSSNRSGGLGKMDVYRLTLGDKRSSLAEIRGVVLTGDNLIPTKSKISLLDATSDNPEEFSHFSTDSVSGEYLLVQGHGKNYKFKVETEGFAPFERELSIGDYVDYYQFFQEIHCNYIKDKSGNIIGQKIIVYTAPEGKSKFRNDTGDSLMFFDLNNIGLGNFIDNNGLSDVLKDNSKLQEIKFYISRDSLLLLAADNFYLQSILAEDYPISFYRPNRETPKFNFIQVRDFGNRLSNDYSFELLSRNEAIKLPNNKIIMRKGTKAADIESAFKGTGNDVFKINGAILKNEGNKFQKSKISIINEDDDIEIAAFPVDSVSMEYSVTQNKDGNYKMKISSKGFVASERNLAIPSELKNMPFYQEIKQEYIKNKSGDIIGQSTCFYTVPEGKSKFVNGKKETFMTFDLKNKGLAMYMEKNGLNDVLKSKSRLLDIKFYITRDSLYTLAVDDAGLQAMLVEDFSIGFYKENKAGTNGNFLKAFNYQSLNPEDYFFESLSVDDIITLPNGKVLKRKGSKVNKENAEASGKPTDVNAEKTNKDSFKDQDISKLPKLILLFDFNKTNFNDNNIKELDGFVEFLKNNPQYKFTIVGHTDGVGSKQYNLTLSKTRAYMVYNYLVKQGINKNRFKTKGEGDRSPVAPNTKEDGSDNEEGRKMNRRVEFIPMQ